MRASSPARAAQAEPALAAALTAADDIVLGKGTAIRLALACLLARGHLLIEDLPGVGKTTLAHLLTRLLGLDFQRIEFRFHPGPVFTHIVLADEINRATPRAQSALLEAMEEGQVTVENQTHALPQPFFVIATQNPQDQVGTFPLPESQLDRFLMCIALGYPDRAAERALLTGDDRRTLLDQQRPVLDAVTLARLQDRVTHIHVSDALLDYVQDLLQYSRTSPQFSSGLSPRAGLALLRAARAWALIEGRDHVLPDDVQAVLPAVAVHRLRSAATDGMASTETVVATLRTAVPIP